MEQLSVVVIDDDPIAQLICKKIIHNCDHNCMVTAFLNPQLAVEYLNLHQANRAQLPDIILLDINMPQLDGFQVLDRMGLMQFKKQIYILMLTSSVSESDRTKATQYSLLSGFESKPFTKEKFKMVREEVLKIR
ncbi:MAG: response regulator [Sphingobacteriaceae bacterium]|nr:response regulator [Sphingobacteriaceae bacterium]